jgi:hypothetical protein
VKSLLRGAALIAWAALLITPAFAQQQGASSNLPRIDRYYEKPFDVASFLRAWEKAGRPAADAVLGFLVGVFSKQPSEIARMADVGLERPGQVIIIQALRFAQKTPEARTFAEKWGWSPEDIANIAPVRPLAATRPEQPGHFDTLWGAAFATGDPIYVRAIYDYYAGVVGEPDIDVNDLVAIIMAQFRSDKESLVAMGKKYPRERLRWVVFGSSALWALDSNAQQHRFIAAAVAQFVKEAPDGPAAKGIAALRAAMLQAR